MKNGFSYHFVDDWPKGIFELGSKMKGKNTSVRTEKSGPVYLVAYTKKCQVNCTESYYESGIGDV